MSLFKSSTHTAQTLLLLLVVCLVGTLPNPAWTQDFSVGREKAQRVDYTDATKQWHLLANQGDVSAQYNLGVMYANGYGVKKDHAKAVEWYSKAAQQGHAVAQYSLGVWYFYGLGVEQNYAQAFTNFS